MNGKSKVALACYLLTILIGLSFAAIYLFRPQFMPYHAAAVGVNWVELKPEFQALFLALMRVSGGGWLAASVSMAILLIIPFRRGDLWARWAIPLIGLSAAGPTLFATLLVNSKTTATAPWFGAAGAILLLTVGLAFAFPKRRKAPGERG